MSSNRQNGQRSIGPLSNEGKATLRFKAIKSGIDAKSEVIPGEDPATLALLTAEYYDHYQPASPAARALVDILVNAEWMRRRFRTLEAQLSQTGLPAAQTYDRLQRRIKAAERTFNRALAALQKIGPQESSPDPQPPASRFRN